MTDKQPQKMPTVEELLALMKSVEPMPEVKPVIISLEDWEKIPKIKAPAGSSWLLCVPVYHSIEEYLSHRWRSEIRKSFEMSITDNKTQ